MDAGTLRGLFTLVMLILFIAICVWAWSGKRKKEFDEAAHMPLESDENDAVGRGGRNAEKPTKRSEAK